MEILEFDNPTLDEARHSCGGHATPSTPLQHAPHTPQVVKYCNSRGYLQCFWECGGNLAAPAVVRTP